MNNLKVTLAALRQKLAASRFDKEVRKGTLQYRDIDPAIPEGELPGFLVPAAKQRARRVMQAPAAVDPETLTRRRALSDALFNAQMGATGEALGVPGLTMSKGMAPGTGPATSFMFGEGGPTATVMSDNNAGRFLRTATRNPLRALIGLQNPDLMLPSADVDKTLNRAILQHEIGEAMAGSSPTYVPHASHLGVEPQLLERLHAQGDPEAVAAMARIRAGHTDDRHVANLIKQMGGTPDSPIPLDSRRARSLKKTLLGDINELSPAARETALRYGTQVPERLPQVPTEYKSLLAEFPERMSEAASQWKPGQRMQTLRSVLDAIGSMVPLHAFGKKGLNPEQLSSLRQALRSGKIPL
jgi:hypothetical protein